MFFIINQYGIVVLKVLLLLIGKIFSHFFLLFYSYLLKRYGVLLESIFKVDELQKGISLGCQWITKNQANPRFGLELVHILAVRLPSSTPIIHQLLWISLLFPPHICCVLQVFLVSAVKMPNRSQISVRTMCIYLHFLLYVFLNKFNCSENSVKDKIFQNTAIQTFSSFQLIHLANQEEDKVRIIFFFY